MGGGEDDLDRIGIGISAFRECGIVTRLFCLRWLSVVVMAMALKAAGILSILAHPPFRVNRIGIITHLTNQIQAWHSAFGIYLKSLNSTLYI
jgi:hypothetical protein